MGLFDKILQDRSKLLKLGITPNKVTITKEAYDLLLKEINTVDIINKDKSHGIDTKIFGLNIFIEDFIQGNLDYVVMEEKEIKL